MRRLARCLRALPLVLISPALVLAAALGLALVDLAWFVLGRRRPPLNRRPRNHAASIVIPNWNGRDLLEKYLPSVLNAIAGNPDHEVIVVDDASQDGSVGFLQARFPQVRVVALPRNLGFGGASNAGFRAAANDIVVLLNSDMRAEPGFLKPLLQGFTDELVFAVSCQIFFSDPAKHREETGLTQGWWSNGGLRVRHRDDPGVTALHPCFYGGGGSCAFDRDKFLELGGFDELLRPFYLEDTDLGYLAWKRGWKVLYEPRSVVWHEHRGTIGKRFPPDHIQGVLKKNFLLFCWKNIHEWPRLASHFALSWAGAVLSVLAGDSAERPSLAGLWRAFLQLPGAMHSRWRARSLATVTDTEAFRRPMGGWFHDRFSELPAEPGRLSVLFVSPYPIDPPVHGGGVFMYQTLCELVRHCDVHLIALLDHEHERESHRDLALLCSSAEFLVRMEGRSKAFGSIVPFAVREFANSDLEWLIHRQMLARRVDIVQLEYTAMAQYAGAFRRIACALFEHDVYFQSIGRAWPHTRGLWRRLQTGLEYLRALRYELRALPAIDSIQVCSQENEQYLREFLPELAGRIQPGLRAGIDTSRYAFQPDGREPGTLLFLGSFRHLPNLEALDWFCRQVYPRILALRADARLIVVGAEPPPRHALPDLPNIELRGFVEDVRDPLSRYAVFLCPILSGSGVRVKLLEAFAAGIPAVSTPLGAEGLVKEHGLLCAIARDPSDFARHAVHLLNHPAEAAAMAARARQEVERNWDMARITVRLEASYRAVIAAKRQATASRPGSPAAS